MRVLPLACVLTTVASLFAACGASDDKKVVPSASAGETAGGSLGAGGNASTTAGAGASPESSAGDAPVGGAVGATGGGAAGTDGNVGGDASLAGMGGAGGAGCEPAPSTLAGQLQGHWLICGALATNARIWNALLTFDSNACTGPELSGTFHWLTTNSGTSEGNTLFTGSHDAETGLISLDEYEVTGGNVVTATDTFTYDPDTDTLTNGAWTCSCSPGTWTSATRVTAGTDVDACP